MAGYTFVDRHIGPRQEEKDQMLNAVGVNSLEELISQTVPSNIRLNDDLNIASALGEFEYAMHIEQLATKNKLFKSFIGKGYYGTITPAPIMRNVLENPGWYTAYTPYQAEIAQGRLEALLNFQTVVSDLTGMDLANASLLDEGTAAAETMIMFYNARSRAAKKANVKKFFVDENMFPQTLDVLRSRTYTLDIELVIGKFEEAEINADCFGVIVQYPASNGKLTDLKDFTEKCHAQDVKVGVASDLMALTMIPAPSSWGADCVFGNSQRFGVPMGFGGPHAAFFAVKEEFKRQIPGRIIGVSKDADGNEGYRMALQTREQHIKRDKATSNICTAQALLAVMASFYAVYHGPKGIRAIAESIHNKTARLATSLENAGFALANDSMFDTITLVTDADLQGQIRVKAEEAELNLYYGDGVTSISIDETTSEMLLAKLAGVFTSIKSQFELVTEATIRLGGLTREVDYLQHPVFNSYHSESDLMRYIKRLENRDMSLTHSMISLGSCTMKLNAVSELKPITHPKFANIHPFVPRNQVAGYHEIIEELEKDLAEITQFDRVSFQPNSGAQGEYTGLAVIKAYHDSRGDQHRDICIIPSSAHGTNPASAVMAGMKVVVVKCDEKGNIDIDHLRETAEKHKENLSALMVTYPSTHGVFEEGIIEITSIIHENGGQVYMDGANMNAQVGLTSPGSIGADVCHLNLHKTFAIPHGGGGPGVGPIGVAKHLSPFLPGHTLVKTGGNQAIHAVSAAPFGSALILLISYGYIKLLGKNGVRHATEIAILNANYLKTQLESEYDVLYKGTHDRVAHEMILDCRAFKQVGVEVEDIAKRLMDYGFHAPTVSFPVAGTLMIEPTESESKFELDKFISAMKSIREEIREIAEGKADIQENVLKNAPHTARMVVSDDWNKPYSREKAAYPLEYIREAKFWPYVRRVDNAYGDRNLVCSCLPIDKY